MLCWIVWLSKVAAFGTVSKPLTSNTVAPRRGSENGISCHSYPQQEQQLLPCSLGMSKDSSVDDNGDDLEMELRMSSSEGFSPAIMSRAFDAISMGRYACTRFHRHSDERTKITATNNTSSTFVTSGVEASTSNPTIVRQAMHCLNLARRAPSGFNVQPYRMVMVHSKEGKENLSKYCLGRNADRVRDSDCTAVFLSDKECGRDFPRYTNLVRNQQEAKRRFNRSTFTISNYQQEKLDKEYQKRQKWIIRKTKALVLLFSSGYPFPRFIASPFSFCIRLGVSIVSVLTRRKVLVPSLGTSETWACKNTMLVAMSFMLGCTSRGLASCPMEGFNAGGIRKALGISRRYAIPIIVSVGLPYEREEEEEGEDDAGMAHGSPGKGSHQATKRYSLEDCIYGDVFGSKIQLPP